MTSPSEYTPIECFPIEGECTVNPIECFPIERECTVDGCNRNPVAKGYCRKHYMRVRRHGDPLAGPEYDPICSVDGCDGNQVAKGYCQKHYRRFKKYGDSSISKRLTEGTAWERVEQRIKKVDHGFYQPCWEFTGALIFGYGSMMYERKMYRTHRISYEHHHGPIPEDLVVDHICANKKCCNPDHLDLVTHEENLALGGTPHFLPRFRSAEEDAAWARRGFY